MPALVDTGATHCVFPVGAAEALGLDVVRHEGDPYRNFRIAGDLRPAIPKIITLTLPPFEELNWDAEVWFFYQEWELPFRSARKRGVPRQVGGQLQSGGQLLHR